MVAVQMKVDCLPFMCVVLCVLRIQGVSCQAWGVNFTHDHICAARGSSVAMPCSFSHPPGLTITKVYWTINPVANIEPTDLSDAQEYKDRVLYSANTNNNCTLTLKQVRPTDAGEYHTRILTENAKGKWLKQPGLSLSVTDLSVWIPTPVIQGSNVRLSCNNTCKKENTHTFIWWKDDKPLSVNGEHNELILINVTMEDEGLYLCALKGFEDHPSSLARLNVMFGPKNTSISVSPSQDVSVGESVALTCSSVAKPPVENYTWFKVDESTPVGTGQQYNITNIRSEDGGQYYCEARNEIGAQKSQFVLIKAGVLPEEQDYMAVIIIGVMVAAIVGISWAIHMIRGQTKVEISEESRAAAGAEASRGEEDDFQYSTIQPHGYEQTEDPQPEEEEEVQYITVYLPKPGEHPAIRPEEGLNTIYCNA